MGCFTSSLQSPSTGDAIGTRAERPGYSASTTEDHSPALQSPLEALPVELQTLIFSNTPDLRSLQSLVRSSPILHRAYCGDRLRILQSVLSNILGGIVVEALATPRCDTALFEEASEAFFQWPFDKEDEARYNMPEDYWLARLDLSDTIKIHHFHIRVMDPLTEQYVNWALASLNVFPEEETTWRQPLRTTERRRVQRAMYRLQVINNVNYQDERQRLRLFSMFPPWGVEQVICIQDFAREIKSEVLQDSALIEEMADYETQDVRREWFYSKYDSAQDFRNIMAFNGDDIHSPPLAWVLFWRGEYSSLYGNYIDLELRRFGYVMWDAARLGERAQARIDYHSFIDLGWTDAQDPRWDYYDPSVRDEQPEDSGPRFCR
ncbi:hypothetical protein KVR01_008826 [Diaporthe batatas]|uniref:uncharacterized protein n=1 Tax=Diaporthe batatas TaxID=748121 RepID=UPI001D05AD62|nr:uncharacterized protein KVR01_008826 [Diaporthe batatas]KAG8161839.1 hypothetical protein KVR01_008826 [Diaporthe batatas]